jgi:plastocyanin
VNKRTAVAFRGTRTWTLTLRRGRYRFFCDAHAARMRGSFRVT